MKKTITTPKIKIRTTEGTFELVIKKSNQVQLVGALRLVQTQPEIPFSLVLRKNREETWEATEITGVEALTVRLVGAFTEWADGHPNAFAMADRIAEHNAKH